MIRDLKKILRRFFVREGREIYPDEIMLDSSNLPNFNTHQFEGRIIKPISFNLIVFLGALFFIIVILFSVKIWNLQVVKGEENNQISENNRLRYTPIFAERGAVLDRNGVELAWNAKGEDEYIWERRYATSTGMAHILGYVKYPSKDIYGFYYREDYEGKDGVEKLWNDTLKGINGLNIVETNALGKIVSQNTIKSPISGKNMTLSIDSRLSNQIYKEISALATDYDYEGGAGMIMDITNGEVIANVSYPEYKSQVLTDGKDDDLINEYINSKNGYFLNKTTDGLYTPGSIVKLFMSMGVLNEGIIDPNKNILSTGAIEVPNDYDPTKKAVFKDWKAHGWVDMRHAIAVSSNVYFYTVGGGFEDQKGLGISNIEKYFKMFGFGTAVKDDFFGGANGLIPTPEWKMKTFNGETWRRGDTYHTSIGQYGFQVSPIQVVRAVASIANNGILPNLSLLKGNIPTLDEGNIINIPTKYFQVVREGMRLAVTEGTAKAVNVPHIEIGAKSGTAEVGVKKEKINSWITGFFPYDKPRYAFVMLMEKGPNTSTIGAAYIMRQTLDWMNINTPEYFK
ncbi:MAG: penicillin-binding transpeptidase domain-containing protein [bacterium]|nr:penicillin-binding transpeptidase domain-containing protein [bacterium]